MVAIHKPAHDIILKPVVSEKSYALSDRGQYTFVVAPNANKVQIKQAIEEIFNVKVTNVNTLNRAGKPRKVKGRTRLWLSAFISRRLQAAVTRPSRTSPSLRVLRLRSRWFANSARLAVVTLTAV